MVRQAHHRMKLKIEKGGDAQCLLATVVQLERNIVQVVPSIRKRAVRAGIECFEKQN